MPAACVVHYEYIEHYRHKFVTIYYPMGAQCHSPKLKIELAISLSGVARYVY